MDNLETWVTATDLSVEQIAAEIDDRTGHRGNDARAVRADGEHDIVRHGGHTRPGPIGHLAAHDIGVGVTGVGYRRLR